MHTRWLTFFPVYKQSDEWHGRGEGSTHIFRVSDGKEVVVTWVSVGDSEGHVRRKVEGILNYCMQLLKTVGSNSIQTESPKLTLKLK